CSRWDFDYW
nr:immunoglobulin heavy chain junction region [Mus musculus]